MDPFYDIDDLKRYARQHGSHFFDPDTMRFFRSRVGERMFPAPDGVYFITSEQFVPSSGPARPRRYTVRFMHESGDISIAGQFQNYASGKAAAQVAKRLSKLPWSAGHAADEDFEEILEKEREAEMERQKTFFPRRHPQVPVRRHARRVRQATKL